MGYTVITTEKPSVAQEYAKVLHIHDRHDGYITGHSDVLNKDVCITWAYGHLVTLSYPEKYDEELKEWRMDTLPFLPEKYKYELIESGKKQFKVIKDIYNGKLFDISEWLSAGDAGREGLYIQCLIRQAAGMKSGVSEKVVWIDSYTESEIMRGIREAKPISEYDKKKAAAYMRAIEDYAVGINYSRALSIKFGQAYRNKAGLQKGAIAVGRVMTCVLAMVVEREREIRAFKETNFYGVTGKVGALETKWKAVEGSKYFESPLLYNDTGFITCENANKLCEEFLKDKELTINEIKASVETKKAPLLFNLAEAQNFFSKKYKMSPNDTLNTIQSLYEKKLVTYPRTDARVLSSAVAKEIKNNLNGLMKLGYKTDVLKNIASNGWHKGLENTQYTDDSKITDHYAIIPTGYVSGVDALSEVERKVYYDIVNRFLCIFYPPAKYDKIEAEFLHSNGEKFFLSSKTLKEFGFIEIIKEKEEIVENPLAGLKKGAVVDADFLVNEGKTTPPKRYTSGSMIIAMENAGKLIEDEELRAQIKGAGIGTSATRAAIIEKLIKTNQISLDKKTQILTPLIAGECTYDIVKDVIPEFLRPDMTASWEKGLEQIENGTIESDVYRKKLEDYVRRGVTKIKEKESSGMTSYEGVKGSGKSDLSSIVCPKCGKGHVTENSKAFGCSEYKNGCDFVIWKSFLGKTLTSSDVQKMLTKGHTNIIKGLRSKAGKSFEARLKWKDGKIELEFPKKEE